MLVALLLQERENLGPHTHTHAHTHTYSSAFKDNILSPLYCDKEVEGGATECDNRTWFFFIYIINVCDSE